MKVLKLCLLVSAFLLLPLFAQPVLAYPTPGFAWDANPEPDLEGYMIFTREDGQDYDYDNPSWIGDVDDTTCSADFGLEDNKTYHFVARAFDIYGNESENSVELTLDATVDDDEDLFDEPLPRRRNLTDQQKGGIISILLKYLKRH